MLKKKAADLLANQAKEKAPTKKVEAKPKAEQVNEEVPEQEDDKAVLEEIKKAKEIEAFNEYQKFAELKFLLWNGITFEPKRLKAEALELYDKLEKKFKASKGHKPKKSQTVVMGLGIPNARIVEGYGVPESLYEVFKEAGKADKYF